MAGAAAGGVAGVGGRLVLERFARTMRGGVVSGAQGRGLRASGVDGRKAAAMLMGRAVARGRACGATGWAGEGEG